MVIIEYVPYGDLLGYLRKSRGLDDTFYKDPDMQPKTSLTSQQLLAFSWQVAEGMTYLSSKKVIYWLNEFWTSMRLNLNSMWAAEDRNGNIAKKIAKLEKN